MYRSKIEEYTRKGIVCNYDNGDRQLSLVREFVGRGQCKTGENKLNKQC